MKSCRSCGSKLSTPFLNLGNSPISNSYLTEEETHLPETYYPLEVYFCPECYLVQIDQFEKPENIFNSKYAYFSSYSSSWLEHCKKYVEEIVNEVGLNSKSLVVEIGSNDGYLLQYFKEMGIPVHGIDPSAETARVAIEKGIPTEIAFFNTSFSKRADLIIANNVIAHTPDPNGFVKALKTCLKPRGVVTVEFPNVMELIKNNLFDTIYQEHYSYFSFHSISKLFQRHGLKIFHVKELSTHGGSLRIYACHGEENILEDISTADMLAKEKWFGITHPEVYLKFGQNVERAKRDILDILIIMKESGRNIVGYGAPAKGNTLLNYCGIGTDFIDYTVDINSRKQGLFLPGTHIPIKHPDQIKIDQPDYVLVLPWNIQKEIVEQLSYIKSWKGKFIILLPKVKII
jgi:2-polyprenyl-3-methyl-5-hydroxy-6-metoxy-1,4-benzoquinol methylase